MASKHNLKIDVGSTFKQELIWKDSAGARINLTGCTARMKVRTKVTETTELLSLTTENNGIVISTHSGGTYPDTITIVIAPALTEVLTAKAGVYDLEVVMANGDVVRLLEGGVTFNPNVTRT